jgi:probable addiction module antidote protein
MEWLKDPEEALGYLNAALEEDDEAVFLLALRDVVKAQGGVSKLSRLSKLHRVNLHRILSKSGNPELKSLSSILSALGLKLAVVSNPPPRLRKAA